MHRINTWAIVFCHMEKKILRKIPFVKGIYSSVKDMTDSFSSRRNVRLRKQPLQTPSPGRYTIGFVTNRIKDRQSGKEHCAVFVPTTPNPTSGFLIIIPERQLIFCDLSVDNALKYIISLGTAGEEIAWEEKIVLIK